MTPAQLARFLPDNYFEVLSYIRHDLGGSCSDDHRVLKKLADHMGWPAKSTSGVLGILTKQGHLRRQGRKWYVVKSGDAAA
jgi:hypothetical protein